MPLSSSVERGYALARERFAGLGVDVDRALARLAAVPISIHCWQGDDLTGFDTDGGPLGGGLAVSGTYPGKARTADELRQDFAKAISLIPGRHRIALHACYAETGGQRVDRDAVEPAHFARWIDWARQCNLGVDFNPTFFLHPKAADGFTLSHRDEGIRQFWIEHGVRCRAIGAGRSMP